MNKPTINSHIDALIRSKIDLFSDKAGERWGIIPTGSTKEIISLSSKRLEYFIRDVYYQNGWHYVPADVVHNNAETIRMLAYRDDVPQRRVFRRMAFRSQRIYYKLNNRTMVTISEKGVWFRKNRMEKVLFHQSEPQVRPNRESQAKDLCQLLSPFFRGNDEDLLYWLYGCAAASSPRSIIPF